jgi:LCP family protein required for cell wall assembly
MVGAGGFEPTASCSQSRRATKLRYAPSRHPSVPRREAPDDGIISAMPPRTRPSLLRGPLGAAYASALIPGLGQLLRGQRRAALLAVSPLLLAALIVLLNAASVGLVSYAATFAAPGRLAQVTLLLVLMIPWRAAVVLHAARGADEHFGERRGSERRGPISLLLAIALFISAAPHAGAALITSRAGSTVDDVFSGFESSSPGESSGPTPTPPPIGDRFTVLLVGADAMGQRTSFNTDSMIIASWDRVGGWVSTISIPRDIVNVPMGNGDVWEPKINSLWPSAQHNKTLFPEGPAVALRKALGAMFGITIDATAVIVIPTFRQLINDIGGVDVHISRPIFDPSYRTGDFRGVTLPKGNWHLDGDCALAYARVRKAAGTDDFNRGGRQQELLVGIRNQLAASGNILSNGLALHTALGDGVRTDLNQGLLPTLAEGAQAFDTSHVVSAQMRAGDGLLRYRRADEPSPYGSVVFFNAKRALQLGARLFPTPGMRPYGWPVAKGEPALGEEALPLPTPSAGASATPTPTPTPMKSPLPAGPYQSLATCNANVPAPSYIPAPDPTSAPSEEPSADPSAEPTASQSPAPSP